MTTYKIPNLIHYTFKNNNLPVGIINNINHNFRVTANAVNKKGVFNTPLACYNLPFSHWYEITKTTQQCFFLWLVPFDSWFLGL